MIPIPKSASLQPYLSLLSLKRVLAALRRQDWVRELAEHVTRPGR